MMDLTERMPSSRTVLAVTLSLALAGCQAAGAASDVDNDSHAPHDGSGLNEAGRVTDAGSVRRVDSGRPSEGVRDGGTSQPDATVGDNEGTDVSAAPGAAVVFHASDPVGPGQTTLLFGGSISGGAGVLGWELANSTISSPPSAPLAFSLGSGGTALEVLQTSDLSAKAVIPAAFTAGEYALRVKTAAGLSEAIILNRAEAWWWLGGPDNVAHSGGTLRVFGKNFGAKPSAWLVDKTGTAKSLALVATGADAGQPNDDYNATFDLPSLVTGSYSLWLTNGLGGEYGFGTPLTVDVVSAPSAWPATVFNVQTQFGARGDGTTNDDSAFQAAATAAANGGLIYIPAGTYVLTKTIVIPAKTVVYGAGAASSILTINNATLVSALLSTNGNSIIRDLTVRSRDSSATKLDAAHRLIGCPYLPPGDATQGSLNDDNGPNPAGFTARCSNFEVSNVTVDFYSNYWTSPPEVTASSGNAVKALYPLVAIGSDIRILNSTLSAHGGEGITGGYGDHMQIIGNQFLVGGGSASLHTGGGWSFDVQELSESVIEGNTSTVLPGETANPSMLLDGEMYGIYIAHNDVGNGNSSFGEAFGTDVQYYPYWLGKPVSFGTQSMTLWSGADDAGSLFLTPSHNGVDPGTFVGLSVTIVEGTGLGQRRIVTASTTSTLTLDSPLTIAPDDTSVIALLSNKTRMVWTANQAENATVAFQCYAQCYDVIVSNNKASKTGGAYALGEDFMSSNPVRRRVTIDYFNQWLNNDFSGAYPRAIVNSANQIFTGGFVGPLGTAQGRTAAVLPGLRVQTNLGDIVRGNSVSDGVEIGVGISEGDSDPTLPPTTAPLADGGPPFGRDNVVEGNSVTGNTNPTHASSTSPAYVNPYGVVVYPGFIQTVVRGNTVSQTDVPFVNHGTDTFVADAGM